MKSHVLRRFRWARPFNSGCLWPGFLFAAGWGCFSCNPGRSFQWKRYRDLRINYNKLNLLNDFCKMILDGVLLIVINYTDDRLNFCLGIERARLEDIRVRIVYYPFSFNFITLVKMVICDDDCALSSPFKAVSRRGFAGSLFLMKAVGALSERGKVLDSMIHELEEMKQSIWTIGASLTSCSVPGKRENRYNK